MKKILITLLVILSTTGMLFANDVLTRENGKLSLYFLDLEVGPDATDKSGDATILISPEGKVMLIDCGHPDSAPQVISALKALNITTIDYFIESHPHIDHIGSFPEIANQFTIKQVYRTALTYDTSQYYRNFVQTIETLHIPTTILQEGDFISFGPSITVEIFNPPKTITYPKNYPTSATQFINNQSMAMKFTYGLSTVWFSGDLYLAQERVLINTYGERLQADVAKANHHGSDTSNSSRWIKTIQPKIVVAMHDEVGSMTVYNNYKKNGAEFHLTFNDGNVKVVMDDQKHYQVFDSKDSWMN